MEANVNAVMHDESEYLCHDGPDINANNSQIRTNIFVKIVPFVAKKTFYSWQIRMASELPFCRPIPIQ